MKAIVFGGSVFIGYHPADALSTAGHAVTIFNQRPSFYHLKNQKFSQRNILDIKTVKRGDLVQRGI